MKSNPRKDIKKIVPKSTTKLQANILKESGYNISQIANILGISHITAKNYIELYQNPKSLDVAQKIVSIKEIAEEQELKSLVNHTIKQNLQTVPAEKHNLDKLTRLYTAVKLNPNQQANNNQQTNITINTTEEDFSIQTKN